MTVKLEDAHIERFNRVSEIANMDPIYCKESFTITEVIAEMLKSSHRRMPIVTNKLELVGVVTTSDILDAFLKNVDFDDTISSIMVRDIITCEPTDTIDFILNKFKISRRGGFPVVQNSKLFGVISERDYVKHFDEIDFKKNVGECMTKKPIVISSSVSILDCLRTLINTHYRRMPVVDAGKLIGIVTTTDLLKYIHENDYEKSALDEALDPVIVKEVVKIDKSSPLADVIKIIKEKEVGGILVVDGATLEGMITERDILEEII